MTPRRTWVIFIGTFTVCLVLFETVFLVPGSTVRQHFPLASTEGSAADINNSAVGERSVEYSTFNNSSEENGPQKITKDSVLPPIEKTMSSDLTALLGTVSEGVFYPAMIRDTPSLATQLPRSGYSPDFPRNGCWRSEEGNLRCIPGLHLGGFPKCGTSDLFEKLTWHPEIRAPGAGHKEIYWWGGGGQSRFHVDVNGYTDKVTPRDMGDSKDAYIADGSPSLVNAILCDFIKRYPDSDLPPYTNADVLHWVLPTAKVIAIVRNPVERAWSAYFYFNDHGPVNPESFEEDSTEMVEDVEDCLEEESLRYCCANWMKNDYRRRIPIHRSIYICYLVDWKLTFGDNFYLVNFDDYRENPMAVLQDIYKWLGVATDIDFSGLEQLVKRVKNPGKLGKKEKMLDKTRLKLEAFFKPYNEMLAEFFENDGFLIWNERSSHSTNSN